MRPRPDRQAMIFPGAIVTMGDIMNRLLLDRMFDDVFFASSLTTTLNLTGTWMSKDQEIIFSRLARLHGDLFHSGMTTSAAAVKVALEIIEKHVHDGAGPITENDVLRIRNILQTLCNVVGLEARTMFFYALSAESVQYVEPSAPVFGEEVARQFPYAKYDIDEAASCIGFSRSTAAVYHLMRVTEIGALAVCRCLGIPDAAKPAERNLGFRLGRIDDKIKERWPTGADRMSGDGHWFEDIYATLDARKDPWRNSTNHPDRIYTLDEAKDIYIATREMMRKIASRCDETGHPLA